MRNIDKKYHYLYKTINLINEKYYFGMHSTNNIDDRYLGSGTYLRRAIRKYGKQNFKREILEQFETREELIQGEILLISKDTVNEHLCMNLKPGGEGGLCGMVTVKDKSGLCFNVFTDDPRYLSGELISIATDRIPVVDKDGNNLSVYRNDSRYLSGELISMMKNKIMVKDKDGIFYQIDINDPRYLSGEFKHISTGKMNVKDKDNKYYRVDINDPRYLSGELKAFFKDKKHTEETKNKIGESNSISQLGDKNSQFGSCWIMKDGINKKIKKDEIQSYINDGWIKGRKLKTEELLT